MKKGLLLMVLIFLIMKSCTPDGHTNSSVNEADWSSRETRESNGKISSEDGQNTETLIRLS